MSNERNFRVSINLCSWFKDHRHRARIFISDDINTIGDLEKRIENIFKIKNFHLISQNEYLPSSEDIRILHKDDIVWVTQNSYEQESTPKATAVVTSNTETIFKNKKRMISVAEDHLEDSQPAKKKKKKKHNLEKSNDTKQPNSPEEKPKKKKHKNGNCATKDQVNITTQVKEVTPKDKKITKTLTSNSNDETTSKTLEEDLCTENESSSVNISKLLPVLQSHIKSYNKKINNRINETESITSTSPFITDEHKLQSELYNDSKEPYKCKGMLSSYKKQMPVPTITDKYLQEKKVNIVKIEYLSGKSPHMNKLELTKNNEAIRRDNQSTLSNLSNIDTNMQNSPVSTPEKNFMSSESRMDQSTEKEESVDQNANSSACVRTRIKFIQNKDKNDITCSPLSSSLVTNEEKRKKYSNGTEILFIKNKSLNNTTAEKEIKITDLEARKSLLAHSNETLSFKQLNEGDKSTQHTPVIGKNSPLEAAINNVCDSINSKLVEPLVKIDPSKEENKSFELKPCGTVLNVSNNSPELGPYPEEMGKNSLHNVHCDADNTNLEKNGINVSTGNNFSVCNQSVNNLIENSSKELQQTDDASYLNNFTNKTNLLDENISLVSQKESTNNRSVNETVINSSNNSKGSDTDVTEDALTTSWQSSIRSHGNSSFSKRKQLSGIGQILGELRSNDSLVTGESMDSDHSEFITKRKRKRVRKRKKKNDPVNDNTSLNDSSIAVSSNYVPKPLRSKACPTIHLKFEEENGEVLKAVDVTKIGSHSVEDTESYLETSGVENITIDSDIDQSRFENFSVKEEYILKSPSIKNLIPKIGDIIAFKILRITENYTPEISSYIIGKVTEFNNVNKIVLYEILNGLEHCKEPKGILSIEETEENTDSNKREFAWADIIDPRLLFP